MTIGKGQAVDLGLYSKIRVTATLEFETAWRIGSGRATETVSDLGVMLTPAGEPVLPGSSIKGKLRSTCESLAHALGMTACMLSREASGVDCVGDAMYYKDCREEYREVSRSGVARRLEWIDEKTCDVCKLFGSPVRTGRLRVADGSLMDWASVIQVRDGVVIDRDSHTAVPRLKYDYDVVPPGSRFGIRFDLENPSEPDLALLGAGLFNWHAGSSIGGFTSRGLGRFSLQDIRVFGVDLTDPEERRAFLTARSACDRLIDRGDWGSYFQSRIDSQLLAREGERE